MLKNRVIIGIIIVLTVFCVLQLVTGWLFYSTVSNDRHNFQRSGILNAQQENLSNSVNALVKTRVTVTRVTIRYLKNQRSPADINGLIIAATTSLGSAEKSFATYQALPKQVGQDQNLTAQVEKGYARMHDVLKMSIQYLQDGNYQAFGSLEAQKAQDEMEATFNQWLSENNRFLQEAAEENQSSFNGMQWTLGIILLVVIAAIVFIWLGLQYLLLNPLHSVIQHIRLIAGGGLTHAIPSEGRNEMSQFASGLHNMQQSLINSLCVVHSSTDSICTGTGEISADNNDLSSRTGQQAASLEKSAASMESSPPR